MSITVSIVSHGHGLMVWKLANKITTFPEIASIILTLNIPERIPNNLDKKITVINNKSPIGFSSNHNKAFKKCKTPYFCVLNPDIIFTGNIFENLLNVITEENIALSTIVLKDDRGFLLDHVRKNLTLISIINRLIVKYEDNLYSTSNNILCCEWFSGAFMVFNAEFYSLLNGFDERYFLYCEDADLCRRASHFGVCPKIILGITAMHIPRRKNRRELIHIYYHITSLFMYFMRWGLF